MKSIMLIILVSVVCTGTVYSSVPQLNTVSYTQGISFTSEGYIPMQIAQFSGQQNILSETPETNASQVFDYGRLQITTPLDSMRLAVYSEPGNIFMQDMITEPSKVFQLKVRPYRITKDSGNYSMFDEENLMRAGKLNAINLTDPARQEDSENGGFFERGWFTVGVIVYLSAAVATATVLLLSSSSRGDSGGDTGGIPEPPGRP